MNREEKQNQKLRAIYIRLPGLRIDKLTELQKEVNRILAVRERIERSFKLEKKPLDKMAFDVLNCKDGKRANG